MMQRLIERSLKILQFSSAGQHLRHIERQLIMACVSKRYFRIDIGQGINVGPGKLKKNNKSRACKIWQKINI